MATVNVDFTNTGNEIATISFQDSAGNPIGPLVRPRVFGILVLPSYRIIFVLLQVLRPNQIIRRQFNINFSYFFTFVRGRNEKTATYALANQA